MSSAKELFRDLTITARRNIGAAIKQLEGAIKVLEEYSPVEEIFRKELDGLKAVRASIDKTLEEVTS